MLTVLEHLQVSGQGSLMLLSLRTAERQGKCSNADAVKFDETRLWCPADDSQVLPALTRHKLFLAFVFMI